MGFQRKPELILRVHDETDADESGKFAFPVVSESRPSQRTYISRIPMISERNVKGIFLYESSPGVKGVAFRLDAQGRLSLSATSVQRVGNLFFVMMNRRNVAELVVDRHVGDGILNVPRGFTDAEIALLRKKFPLIGDEQSLGDSSPRKP